MGGGNSAESMRKFALPKSEIVRNLSLNVRSVNLFGAVVVGGIFQPFSVDQRRRSAEQNFTLSDIIA